MSRFLAADQSTHFNNNLLTLLIAIVIGLLSFFLIIGPEPLNPTNIAWLGAGDQATYYLGWLYFRHSDWSFPLGLNPSYGLELGNGLIYSDSNPLMAFIFKPLSPWLPEPFQYFGIWQLLCFILQAFFGWKLLSLATESLVLRILGSLFFLFSPPMLFRLFSHLNLGGHFLILAALYFYVKPEQSHRKFSWCLLMGVTALVHAYILGMVATIWLADLLTKVFKRQLSFLEMLIEFLMVISATGFACWQSGYFSVKEGFSSGGFGVYRMNILSLLDPDQWSFVLKDISGGVGDYEGFNYLGFGCIFLLVLILPILFEGKFNVFALVRKHAIFLALFLCLTAFALSNKIGFGPYGIEYPLPDSILKIANIFRSSGRMFWPVYYLIVFSIIYCIVRSYDRRTAVYLLSFSLVVQIIDTYAGWGLEKQHHTFEPSSTWTSKLTDPFWEAAAKRYSKVRWIMPANAAAHWLELGAYAGNHRLASDTVYLARVDESALVRAREKSNFALHTGQYDADSLYVLDDSVVPLALMNLLHKDTLCAKVDNMVVIAPGWKDCLDCPMPKNKLSFYDYLAPLKFGQRKVTNQAGSGLPYLVQGWSGAEGWGVWSSGNRATIILPTEGNRPRALIMEAFPFVVPSHPKQRVAVSINNTRLPAIRLSAHSDKVIELNIPDSVFDSGAFRGFIKVDFRFPDAASPLELGAGQDSRKLAIGLSSLTLR